MLSDEDILAIRFGIQSGTLAASIRDMLDQPDPAVLVGSPRWRKFRVYLCLLFVVAFVIVTFSQIKIVPAFRQIFAGVRNRRARIAGVECLFCRRLREILVSVCPGDHRRDGGSFFPPGPAGGCGPGILEPAVSPAAGTSRGRRAAEAQRRRRKRAGRSPARSPPWPATTSTQSCATSSCSSAMKWNKGPTSGRAWRSSDY